MGASFTSMPTRQELYDRIRNSSKDEVILDEMIRLGFWPKNEQVPNSPAEIIKKKGQLEKELSALVAKSKRLNNIEALKRAARKNRLLASREKQKQTKQKRIEAKRQKAEAWQVQQEKKISYLGPSISYGLKNTSEDTAKLRQKRLPSFKDDLELAKAMNLSIKQLRFLCFYRKTATLSHYIQFSIPKKTGGLRKISAPMPLLKQTQLWILKNILEKVELHPAAHGFRKGRSIITNALPHQKQSVVINIDLKDFFPTINYRRIKGVFSKLGYSEHNAILFASLCSQHPETQVSLDNKSYHVSTGDRILPQGAPTSPAITNIICRGLDARLQKAAQQFGFNYTRYADDITFSGPKAATSNIGKVLQRISYVVAGEGFEIHPKKTRIFRKGSRQEVTGLVVNDFVNIPRKTLKQFRATLFQIEKDGPAGKHWGQSMDTISAIEGFANFVLMVNPTKGKDYQNRVKKIIQTYGRSAPMFVERKRWQTNDPIQQSTVQPNQEMTAQIPAEMPTSSSQPQKATPKKPWWKFW